ncbi:MAG: hypothetical protein WCG04_06515 [Alphaproteobacteria bacterium]
MKLTFLISSVCLSILLLPQAAQADISQTEAQTRLTALGKVMHQLGVEKGFTAINSHSGVYSFTPDARDQLGTSDLITALNSEGGAHTFCVKNNMLVASTLYPSRANGTLDVMAIEDGKGEKPFVKMKDALKNAEGTAERGRVAVVEVTNVFPGIVDATNSKSLTTKHSVLVANRRSLIGDEEANRNQGEKFYCGITNIRAN